MRLVIGIIVFCVGYLASWGSSDWIQLRPETSGGPLSEQVADADMNTLRSAERLEVERLELGEVSGHRLVSGENNSDKNKEGGSAEPPASSSVPLEIQQLMLRLDRSIKAMESFPGYEVTLEQQVLKNGNLLDPVHIDIKLRRTPFSVFLKWHHDGQEVLYVEGKHNGRLLAHPTRGLARIRSVWKLIPTSSQAMKDCRYPLTSIGIENLSRMALEFYTARRLTPENCVCITTPVTTKGEGKTRFEVTFADDQISPEISLSQLTFDDNSGMLIAVHNQGWDPQGKKGGLLESYHYHGFKENPELCEEDFSEHNTAYSFAQ